MKPKSTNDGMSIFESIPFSTLVKDNGELAALRRDYASRPARERRMAAEWEYHSQMASELFNNSMALSGKDRLGKSFWPSGVVALAIDPLYAPAILTVGSIEYQLGRIEEAMKLFKRLAELPKDAEDLRDLLNANMPFIMSSNFKAGGIEYEDIDSDSQRSILTDCGIDCSLG